MKHCRCNSGAFISSISVVHFPRSNHKIKFYMVNGLHFSILCYWGKAVFSTLLFRRGMVQKTKPNTGDSFLACNPHQGHFRPALIATSIPTPELVICFAFVLSFVFKVHHGNFVELLTSSDCFMYSALKQQEDIYQPSSEALSIFHAETSAFLCLK